MTKRTTNGPDIIDSTFVRLESRLFSRKCWSRRGRNERRRVAKQRLCKVVSPYARMSIRKYGSNTIVYNIDGEQMLMYWPGYNILNSISDVYPVLGVCSISACSRKSISYDRKIWPPRTFDKKHFVITDADISRLIIRPGKNNYFPAMKFCESKRTVPFPKTV